MIYIKIRPLSELHYPVCLRSGTFTVQLHGSAAGAGHCNWFLKSLSGEEGSGSPENRLWERFSSSSSHPFSPNFIRSSHLTTSMFKSLHAADKKHFLLEKVQFRPVVKIQQQLAEISLLTSEWLLETLVTSCTPCHDDFTITEKPHLSWFNI